jgi:membrane-anchored glycerophosphoryl diester phosphodiesterase (GDPDase)
MNTKTKLDYATILKEGFAYSTKNIPSLLGAIVLWILTIWIPYVNVGTTIAICTLPLQLSRGDIFSPLSIFDKKYYRYMGEYFLTLGLMGIGIIGAALFFIIPGIVVSLAWSLAILLLLDKGLNAAEAIRMSNRLTYGNKWTMFFIAVAIYGVYLTASLILGIILNVIMAILSLAGSIEGSVIMNVSSFIVLIALLGVCLMFNIGCQASIYGTLSKNIEEQH